ncbi:MAG: hypothetical protein M1834_008891 [Cirrosporium novae-zelandiae]|nr:MAG: hypothetical protein M1834_008891 [Cirrosporium novae-zelandiae]
MTSILANSPPPMALFRYIIVAVTLCATVFWFRSLSFSDIGSQEIPSHSSDPPQSAIDAANSLHPIDVLIKAAEEEFSKLRSQETNDVNAAAEAYRKRRGRHPPPGFDAWFNFAKEKNAVIVEDFWDPIYHDLGPFWGLPPKQIRKEAKDFEMILSIRNGEVQPASEWFWTQIWKDLIGTVAEWLPDMDLALNAMDEPRLVVPWEQINEYIRKGESTRKVIPKDQVISRFSGLEGDEKDAPPTTDKEWESTRPFWEIARRGCPPNSLARKAGIMQDFTHRPPISMELSAPHSYRGYVSNFTLLTDICHQPDLQTLHGALIYPLTVVSTKKLFPMFGGSKFGINNEILLPAPMYWSDDERFSTGDEYGSSWSRKNNGIIWRGVATGGNNTKDNWRGFQRHRFISMTNGTKVRRAELWEEAPENFALPEASYDLMGKKHNHLGDWLDSFSDVSFVDLFCHGVEARDGCNHTEHYFSTSPGIPMATQFKTKYLPDIDGNSFSGRYRSFLLSTSLPIKSTLFREWHDTRLIPWVHFVPMDNRYGDFYGIMEYFLGYKGFDHLDTKQGLVSEGHDATAEKIAMQGHEWASKVLRKEDMQVYVLRLLLEYARVSDDQRDRLGWVGDL